MPPTNSSASAVSTNSGAPIGQRISFSPSGVFGLTWHTISAPPTIPSFATVIASAQMTGMVWQDSNGSFFNRNVLPSPHTAQDHWHRTNGLLPLLYVPSIPSLDRIPGHPMRNAPISIPFAPANGPGTLGVAMSELLLAGGRGIFQPEESIRMHIPLPFRATQEDKDGLLVIELPGHARFISQFQLRDESSGEYVSRRLFAMQIANAFHYLSELIKNNPSGDPTALSMEFDQLRLLEVVSFNAKDFYVRVMVVSRPPRFA
ncbi:hypothetical protein C8F01DRAFT_332941 [Mycena amicta]|nr:hypothetical protein C8F01DRAFT_332941 [Mycena amicta]